MFGTVRGFEDGLRRREQALAFGVALGPTLAEQQLGEDDTREGRVGMVGSDGHIVSVDGGAGDRLGLREPSVFDEAIREIEPRVERREVLGAVRGF